MKPLKATLLLCAIIPLALHSQPVFVFRNSTLQSGTALQQNAVYKFANVYTNTDALVTIVGFTNGMTLATFDVDASGYMDAFQPLINCPASKKAYVEFRVDFVEHSNNSIAKTMTEVAMTGLDIDGFTFPSGKICEFNQFKTTPSYYVGYNMAGGLTFSLISNWYEALNQPATFYSGIDTAVKDVMFSLVSASVSSVSLRVGTDNKATQTDQRQSSVYFRNFSFQNYVLAAPKLKTFTGNAVDTKVNLEWSFASLEGVKNVSIQKAVNSNVFHTIGETGISDQHQSLFTHTDHAAGMEKVYYRLVITSVEGKVTYSNILPFQFGKGALSFGVFPSTFNNSITLNVKSEKSIKGSFSLVNYAGSAVYQETVNLSEGINSVSIHAGRDIPAGNYIAVLETGGSMSTQKVVKISH